jgi:hypothetical protein
VQIDALALRLRPRTAMEAADLGVRLCQHAARPVYVCYAVVALPVFAIALASIELADWLPSILIWWSKPWLDRTILFALSRSAFGQNTTPADVWREQRQVWWRQFFFTWTVRRFSMWRSLTQPVYTLERLSIRDAHDRVRQVRGRTFGPALLMTQTFSWCELALEFGLISLLYWLAPSGQAPDLFAQFFGDEPGILTWALPLSYAIVVLFLEPFYVAAGFGMYLNRRAELEAWDIEQEFRRAFAA